MEVQRPNPFKAKAEASPERYKKIEDLFHEFNSWFDHMAPASFDPAFVNDLEDKFYRDGDLSASQIRALENILDRWAR